VAFLAVFILHFASSFAGEGICKNAWQEKIGYKSTYRGPILIFMAVGQQYLIPPQCNVLQGHEKTIHPPLRKNIKLYAPH